MTLWSLVDRAVPVLAVAVAGGVGLSLGRAWERLDWVTGRRSTCSHDPACDDTRGSR